MQKFTSRAQFNTFRYLFGQLVSTSMLFLLYAHPSWAQTVGIQSVSPNPAQPGQTLSVVMSSSGTPTGCVLTMIPFGQGNQASIVSLDQPPPLQASIPLPSSLPLGSYSLQINCNPGPSTCISGEGCTAKYVGSAYTVAVGTTPAISAFAPTSESFGKTVTITGTSFGQTQGGGYVELVGAGLPSVYIANGLSWSNTSITFTVPEYASLGVYQVVVQSGANGASAPMAGFSVAPAITGWVDLHTHPLSNLGFGGKLIYGADDNNGSLFVLGNPTNVLGVVAPGSPCPRNRVANETQALSEENTVRGPGGPTLGTNPCGDSVRTTITGILETELKAQVWNPLSYTSSGYPNFPTWPAWNDLVNQKMYYSWMQRAYTGGERVLVALAVNSKLLADMTSGPGDGPDDDMGSGDLQITEIKSFVARHSDFMQLAMNSNDILNIVSQNKLAVVIGVELDNIGDLVGNQPASAIVAEVDRLYGEGVRYIFPIHLVDNPIGGSAVYVDLFNVANNYEEGSGYALGCSNPTDGISYVYNPPSPLIAAGAFVKLGTHTPGIPSAVACHPGSGQTVGNVNTEGLTAAGQLAIQEMMNKHMLIDIDHMSQLSADMTITLAQQHQPYPYPLNSGHNGIRGVGTGPFSERSFSTSQYAAIGSLHGMAGVGSAQLPADKWLSMYSQVLQAMGPGAVAGFGTDMNGMEFAMPPRPGSSVQYTAAFPMSTEGNKSWNYNSVGVAHYGMLPDFLQDVESLPGGAAVVSNMAGGAQYFYETWRLAEGNPPAPPAPAQPPPPSAPPVCPGIQELNTSGNTGNITGSGPACVCPPTTQLNSVGVCACMVSNAQWTPQYHSCVTPTGTGTVTGTGGPLVPCPSQCKYGCNAQRICSPPPKQFKTGE